MSDLQEYLELRRAHVEQLKASGDNPYPHKFHVSISLTEFIEKYSSVADGEHHADVVSVAGKLWQLFGFRPVQGFQMSRGGMSLASMCYTDRNVFRVCVTQDEFIPSASLGLS